jgi:hypothetical protein
MREPGRPRDGSRSALVLAALAGRTGRRGPGSLDWPASDGVASSPRVDPGIRSSSAELLISHSCSRGSLAPPRGNCRSQAQRFAGQRPGSPNHSIVAVAACALSVLPRRTVEKKNTDGRTSRRRLYQRKPAEAVTLRPGQTSARGAIGRCRSGARKNALRI